jgi:hypothetical protein
LPSAAVAGVPLTLSGTVLPADADRQAITWSISYDPGSIASLSGATFVASAAGAVTVRALITDGLRACTDFTVFFQITVLPAGFPVVSATARADGTVGAAYSQTLVATGTTPVTWTLDVSPVYRRRNAVRTAAGRAVRGADRREDV